MHTFQIDALIVEDCLPIAPGPNRKRISIHGIMDWKAAEFLEEGNLWRFARLDEAVTGVHVAVWV